MNFRTIIRINDNHTHINHHEYIMMLGSCFSDNIGNKMRNAMMHVDVNPFGTVYNPASILSEIRRIISGNKITAEELFCANGMWNHFSFHSQFSSSSKDAALEQMNLRLSQAHEHLSKCDTVIITLGTAFVYEHTQSKTVVSNCHKLPACEFSRRMLRIEEVKECLKNILGEIQNYTSNAKVIFTVSPIRHISDGLEQNQLSKSTLRVAIGDIIADGSTSCNYFPAYEIMMDDLRDYRFYATDMVHPSDVAVEYIWNTFKATYFNDHTAQAVLRCERISKRLSHRHMTDNKEAITRFQTETANIVANLIAEYPYLKNLQQLKTIL